MHRNLLSLKYYDGRIEDLELNFTMATEELGQTKVVKVDGVACGMHLTLYLCHMYRCTS